MTSAPIAVIDGVPIDLPQALGAALAALAFLLMLTLVALMRASAARGRERDIADERQEAIEARFAALAQSSAELNGRLSGMAEWLGDGIEKQAQRTGENLGKLNERLAVIDAAQARLHRNDARGRVAEGHSRQQAGARRLRPGEDGGDRP